MIVCYAPLFNVPLIVAAAELTCVFLSHVVVCLFFSSFCTSYYSVSAGAMDDEGVGSMASTTTSPEKVQDAACEFAWYSVTSKHRKACCCVCAHVCVCVCAWLFMITAVL